MINEYLLVFSIILILLVTPLIGFLIYLGKYLTWQNGNARKFRRLMFTVTSAKLIFLGTELFTVFTVLRTGHITGTTLTVLDGGAILLCLVNWYAFFKTRSIIRDEIKHKNY